MTKLTHETEDVVGRLRLFGSARPQLGLPVCDEAADLLERLSDRIDVLTQERKRHLERLRQYQSHLQIVPMLLGSKAWELWRGWVDKEWLPTMLYQHYSWGPKARPGDGEAIAEMLLNVRDELASGKCKPLNFDD